ncbi:glutamine-hydrolyzing carbamoyl-phosphate synthase small subunit [Candidatus Peregrinibacteria bacterium]|jgi:carbamoyl-phosphate synthase small subunit|nr:glutamine-hydrolyzing carbamoyl-phosphate synthase small subunit [Candidatus Peregrinibacteria bacterium]
MQNATLVLKDGTRFTGNSFGAETSSAGEVVFNTGMMGYPESFTDPSYSGQIMVLTYPLIGNYGVGGGCKDDDGIEKRFESGKIHIKGLIVNEYSENYSHWDANKSLGEWLKKNDIPAITGIDTRALTQKIREHGTLLGKIEINEKTDFYNPDLINQVALVSPKKTQLYKKGTKKIVCVDCGMKNNIIREFLNRDITVLRVPWDYDFVGSGEEFDGVFLSNGPGDPALLGPLIENVKKALPLEKPIFGICLGTQIMAHASGAKTYKLKFGHRSQNQPCTDEETKRCYITSQNHGFAIDEKSLKPGWEVWLRNANDQTVEGIKHKSLPFFSCQFHPEATPGPTDTTHFFDEFVKML